MESSKNGMLSNSVVQIAKNEYVVETSKRSFVRVQIVSEEEFLSTLEEEKKFSLFNIKKKKKH